MTPHKLPQPVCTGESALEWQGFQSFQLVSLWDMLRRYASAFYQLGVQLDQLIKIASFVMDTNAPGASETVESGQRVYETSLAAALGYCETCELDISALAIRELQAKKWQIVNNANVTVALEEIHNTIRREALSVAMLLVPKNRQNFYISNAPFGLEVAVAFRSAGFDVTEATKCFALGRDTACVFHLTRATEVALRALALAVGASATVPSWDGILKKIDTELQADYKDRAWEKTDQDFYADAALHLRNYKNSRNSTMHVEAKYTATEAERMLDAVRLLMQHLATRLREDDTIPI